MRLSNGNSYDLRDPGAVIVMKSNVLFALRDDRFKIVALIHIASAESLLAA